MRVMDEDAVVKRKLANCCAQLILVGVSGARHGVSLQSQTGPRGWARAGRHYVSGNQGNDWSSSLGFNKQSSRTRMYGIYYMGNRLKVW